MRALGAYYLRLTGRPAEIYQYLEPLYNDYRKLRRRLGTGEYGLSHMDEFVDEVYIYMREREKKERTWTRGRPREKR